MNAMELASLLRMSNALSAPPVDAYEPQAAGLNAFQVGFDGPTRMPPTRPGFMDRLRELGALWYDRLVGGPLSAMERVGGALSGRPAYGPVDEVNLPRVIAQKQAQDVLEALGLYAGPTVAASRPALNAMSVFGGLRAKWAPREMRDIAAKALEAGRPEAEVWKSTGWMRGKDGKWRFEIDDSRARWIGPRDAENMGEIAAAVGKRTSSLGRATLGNYMRHDELFLQYPELKSVEVSVVPRKGSPLNGANAGFSAERNTIYIADDMAPGRALQSVIHEIQHWVQKKEGFARGGNPTRDMWRQPALRDELIKEARAEIGDMLPSLQGAPEPVKKDVAELAAEIAQARVYDRLLGEREARAAAERLWWAGPERAGSMPAYPQDAIVWLK